MIKLHSGTNKYFIIKVTKVNLKLLVLYDKDKDEWFILSKRTGDIYHGKDDSFPTMGKMMFWPLIY